MSYQVLARRLRPKGFDALVGQDHVVRALRNGLESGRVHHAYLFTGTRGVGKTTIARILAKCLNCEQGVTSSPCGECSICREVEENRFLDLVEVDAASRTKVDDTRELLDNAQYKPSVGRYKVYLIDEVHMLSASSFNAFLKTLEEPPEHVKFLLATTDPKKVPVTVLSRCLQFQLKNIGRDEIARYIGEVLAEEDVEYEAEAVRIIAKSARGSMRDALSITDQAIAYGGGSLAAADVAAMVGAAGRDEIGAVIEALASGAPRRILELSTALADKAADFRLVLAELLEALHGMAVDQALGRASEGGLNPETVQLYYQIALVGYRDLFVGPDPKTGFEMTLLRMLAFAPDAKNAATVPPATTSVPPATASVPPVAASVQPAAGGVTDSGVSGNNGETRSAEADTDARSSKRTEETQKPGQAPDRNVLEQQASENKAVALEAGEKKEPGKIASEKAAAPETAAPETAAPETAAPSEEGRKKQAIERISAESTAVQSPPAELAAPYPESIESSPTTSQTDGGELCRDWYELLERSNLKGIDRMIAEHSMLAERHEGAWRLVLDRKHASLLSGTETDGIEQALAKASGEIVRLDIDVGDPEHETPAERNTRLARERQAAARRHLEENPTVQSLLKLFDGQLENVRPLDEAALAAPHQTGQSDER